MVMVDVDCFKIHAISTESGIRATVEEIGHTLWLKAFFHEICLLLDLCVRLRDRNCNMCLPDILLLCRAAVPAQHFKYTMWIAPAPTDISIHLDILFLYSKTIQAAHLL